MIFFLSFFHLFLFSNQNKYANIYGNIIKDISKENISSYYISIYSPNNKSISKINNNTNYCFKSYDNKIKNQNNSFLGSGIKITNNYENFTIYILILLSIANIIIYCIFRFGYSNISRKLEVNNIANFLLISCLIFIILYGISIVYSMYKSYLFVNIYYLLDGYKILYFHDPRVPHKKYTSFIILALLESITTLLILYIKKIQRINLYFICGRNIIECLILFVIVIKMFIGYFINLYRQYRFERRIRTALTLSYKYKLIIYSKVFIFSLIYSLSFIAFNIFSILTIKKKEYIADDFDFDEMEFIYYNNISLTILFAMIFSIMFFPLQTSLYFFMESNININMYFLAEIKKKKEKNMKINNLNKKILKQIYYKKEYPLILLEPFAKTNNFLNDCCVHVGITKKK